MDLLLVCEQCPKDLDRVPKISSPIHVGHSEARYEIWLLSTSRITKRGDSHVPALDPRHRHASQCSRAPQHFGQYAQTPIYHKPVTVEAPLDEKGCLAVELPFTEAKMVSFGPQREVKLFLEPGATSYTLMQTYSIRPVPPLFRPRRGNNQFLAALRSRFPDYLRNQLQRLGGRCLSQMIDQRRLEMTRFLDEGCNQYQLTPAFVDYYRAEITYEWAEDLVAYPRSYERQNGRENEAIPDDYFDALEQVELVDETAIGTSHYRTFCRVISAPLDRVERPARH